MLQQTDRAIAQQCACIGERNATIRPLKQRYSQFILELLHLARQRRLRDVQKGRCTGHAAEFGDLKKKAKLANVHRPVILPSALAQVASSSRPRPRELRRS